MKSQTVEQIFGATKMEYEPRVLVFRDIRVNCSYSTSVCITNPLNAAVEFTLKPSSPRYTVNPRKVYLASGQSIVVTVKLFLHHMPNFGQHMKSNDDCIILKSAYFDQKIVIECSLHATASASRSRSPSPMNMPSHARATIDGSTGTTMHQDLQGRIQEQSRQIRDLKDIIDTLESKDPSLKELIERHVQQERNIFDQKSEKVKEFNFHVHIALAYC